MGPNTSPSKMMDSVEKESQNQDGSSSLASSAGSCVLVVTAQNKARLAAENKFQCRHCERVLTLTEMSASRRGACVQCYSAYNSLQRRWNQCRKLKAWWDALPPGEKTQWYVKQTEVPTSAKRKFSALLYQEQTVNEATFGEKEQDRFVPWSVYKREGLKEGRDEKLLAAEFQELVDDPNVECLYRREQWLVPSFEGVLRSKATKSKHVSAGVRHTEIASADHLTALQNSGSSLREQFLSSAPTTLTGKNDGSWVQGQLADQPVPQCPTDLIARAIGREALQCMSRGTERERGRERGRERE